MDIILLISNKSMVSSQNEMFPSCRKGQSRHVGDNFTVTDIRLSRYWIIPFAMMMRF